MTAGRLASPEGWLMPGGHQCRVRPCSPCGTAPIAAPTRHSYRLSRNAKSVSGAR